MDGHFVTVVAVQKELPKDATKFSMSVAYSQSGRVLQVFVYAGENDSSTTLAKNEMRRSGKMIVLPAQGDPFLTIAFSSAQTGEYLYTGSEQTITRSGSLRHYRLRCLAAITLAIAVASAPKGEFNFTTTTTLCPLVGGAGDNGMALSMALAPTIPVVVVEVVGNTWQDTTVVAGGGGGGADVDATAHATAARLVTAAVYRVVVVTVRVVVAAGLGVAVSVAAAAVDLAASTTCSGALAAAVIIRAATAALAQVAVAVAVLLLIHRPKFPAS